jgi:hypothetical protein
MLQYTQQTYQLGSTAATAAYYELPVGTISAGVAQTTGRQFFIPVRFDNKVKLYKIGTHATSIVATAVARVGLYRDAGQYYPRPGVLMGEAAATLNVAAAGYVEGTVDQAITKPGIYWLSIVTQVAAGTLDCATAVDSGVPLNFGTTAPAAVGTVGAYYQSSITAALADVALATSLVGAVTWPWIWFSVYNA